MLFRSWEEIKNELKDKYKNFNPANLTKEISGKAYSDFDKNYITKDNPTFLPNWLQEVVNILDNKINPSDDKK